MSAVVHGKRATYIHLRCRCESCRLANAEWQSHRTRERHELMLAGVLTPTHGTKATYVNYLCRCGPCTAGNAETCRAYKRKRAS